MASYPRMWSASKTNITDELILVLLGVFSEHCIILDLPRDIFPALFKSHNQIVKESVHSFRSDTIKHLFTELN